MEGQQYYSYNPALFSDRETFSYADLRSICKQLSLGGNGTRCSLETKLFEWHRKRDHSGENLVRSASDQVNISMNVEGSNFNILPIHVEIIHNSHDRGKKRQRRSSIMRVEINNNKENSMSGSIFSPSLLQVRPLRGLSPTPRKSILKNNHNNTGDKASSNSPPRNKLPCITFSPLNGVRVIPHRSQEETEETEGDHEGVCWDGEDEDDEDEEFEEEEFEEEEEMEDASDAQEEEGEAEGCDEEEKEHEAEEANDRQGLSELVLSFRNDVDGDTASEENVNNKCKDSSIKATVDDNEDFDVQSPSKKRSFIDWISGR